MTELLAPLVRASARTIAPLWPLDRAVAINPLVDLTDEDFPRAMTELGHRLGVDPWPHERHLASARGERWSRRGAVDRPGTTPRPGTIVERLRGADSPAARVAREIVARTCLAACSTATSAERSRRATLRDALLDPSVDTRAPRPLRAAVAQRLVTDDLATVRALLPWDDRAVAEEFARHLARVPGWAGWAKWCDEWSHAPHPAALSLTDLLVLSLSVDLEIAAGEWPNPPQPPSRSPHGDGPERLHRLEHVVHDGVIDRLTLPARPSSPPLVQVAACIDVRSEPLRRALEEEPDVTTIGFAGFFGVAARVTGRGEDEPHESFPPLLRPSVDVSAAEATTPRARGPLVRSTLVELTHEPASMFALAEGAGWITGPVLSALTLLPSVRRRGPANLDDWHVRADDPVAIAEGALRGMGLTTGFAPEVVILGHSSHTSANTHFSTLACGACGAGPGGPNAAALVQLLNDPAVRAALDARGVAIPPNTRFVAGEHDTATDHVTLDAMASTHLRARVDRASDRCRRSRRDQRRRLGLATPYRTATSARDWADPRPEWGLAGHVAMVIGPRERTRGVDLGGRVFLHSYDPASDPDGTLLRSIFAAPLIVAQWINAAYYASAVAPDVLGAGDKTLLNPVGDFAVIRGSDPDLRPGLPLQSLYVGDVPIHLPTRLLVAVDAPRERVVDALSDTPAARDLVVHGWVVLAAREHEGGPWWRWSTDGWGAW